MHTESAHAQMTNKWDKWLITGESGQTVFFVLLCSLYYFKLCDLSQSLKLFPNKFKHFLAKSTLHIFSQLINMAVKHKVLGIFYTSTKTLRCH